MLFPKGLNLLSNHLLFSQSKIGQTLQKLPLGFIDVGARGGAHDLVEPIAKNTAVLGFEPDEDECQRLMQKPEVFSPWAKFVLKPVALAEGRGKSELKLLSANTNHSLLHPNNEFTRRYHMNKWEVVGTCDLVTDSLDNILFNQLQDDIQWGEFIKMDTQGTEYEILQGSSRVLKERTVALITEVAFCELYRDQKLFSEVEIFLRQYGFSFYGFTSLHTRSKKILDKRSHVTRERTIYSDAIFFKDPLAGGYNINLSERQSHVLFTVALLLGYYDFAYELAKEKIFIHATLSEQEAIGLLIKELSLLPSENTYQNVRKLVKQIESDPAAANVIAGNFVDQRRQFCDYDDVLNVSPLPKTL